MRHKWLILALVVALLSVLPGARSHPATAQPDLEVVFAQFANDGQYRQPLLLLTCNRSGCAHETFVIHYLGRLETRALGLAQTPDHLAVVAHFPNETRESNANQLIITDLEGNAVRTAPIPLETDDIGTVSLNPDSTRIALSSYAGQDSAIYIVSESQWTEGEYIVEQTLTGFAAHWSPDGRYLAYQYAYRDPARFGNALPRWRVVLYDPEALSGWRSLLLTSDLLADCYAPHWLSATEVIYRCASSAYEFDPVYLTDLETYETRLYLDPGVPGCLRVAPDGSRLAFIAPERHLYIWDIAAQSMQTITTDRFLPTCDAIWIQ